MIPPALSLFFDRCARGEASPAEYAKALAVVDAAFGRNQLVASGKARALRADGYMPRRDRLNGLRQGADHFAEADKMIESYSDRQMAAAGEG